MASGPPAQQFSLCSLRTDTLQEPQGSPGILIEPFVTQSLELSGNERASARKCRPTCSSPRTGPAGLAPVERRIRLHSHEPQRGGRSPSRLGRGGRADGRIC